MSLTQNYITAPHQVKIDQLLHKVKEDPRIFGLVLFGSALVQPNYHDIDICLFSEKQISTQNISMEYLYATSAPLDIKFFEELPLYIQVRVIKNGIILLQKDYNKLSSKYIETIQKWRDFEPLFHVYLEAVKHG